MNPRFAAGNAHAFGQWFERETTDGGAQSGHERLAFRISRRGIVPQ